jgi:hypothetical protein
MREIVSARRAKSFDPILLAKRPLATFFSAGEIGYGIWHCPGGMDGRPMPRASAVEKILRLPPAGKPLKEGA